MKEVSVNLKGSSFLVGHERERRDSEEESLSFCKVEGVEDEEERESSKVSAIWSTKGSERAAYVVRIEGDFEENESFDLRLSEIREDEI